MYEMKNKTLMSKIELISSLSAQQKAQSIAHFNDIYECKDLGVHEEKIIYLAYLWKNGAVEDLGDGFCVFANSVTDVTIEDYELTFECDEGMGGGINMHITHEFYNLDELMSKLI
jgi:hypothetical protein